MLNRAGMDGDQILSVLAEARDAASSTVRHCRSALSAASSAVAEAALAHRSANRALAAVGEVRMQLLMAAEEEEEESDGQAADDPVPEPAAELQVAAQPQTAPEDNWDPAGDADRVQAERAALTALYMDPVSLLRRVLSETTAQQDALERRIALRRRMA